jgi:hypothetical protein
MLIVLRMVCAIVLTGGIWGAATATGSIGTANADLVEYLMVPSAAMGHGIPVAGTP